MNDDDVRPITRQEIIREIASRCLERIEGEPEAVRGLSDVADANDTARVERARVEREQVEREQVEQRRAERERDIAEISDRVARAITDRRSERDRLRARERLLQAKRQAELEARRETERKKKRRRLIYTATSGITLAEIRDIVDAITWLWNLIPIG